MKNIPICKKVGGTKSNKKHPMNKMFDEVIVLHLRNHRFSAQRFNQVSRELSKEGIVGYTYPAILGRDVTVENSRGDEVSPEFVSQCLKVNPGGLGQLMSMIRVLKYIVDAPHIQKAMFFEDDFKLNKDFKKRFVSYMADVPDSWDLVYLGMSSNHRQTGLLKDVDIHKPESLKYNNVVTDNVIIPKGGTGNYAVAISKKGAQKLLKKLLPIRKDSFNYTKFMKAHAGLGIPADEFPVVGSLDVYISKLFPSMNVYYLRNRTEGDLVDFKTGRNNPSTINNIHER